MQCWSFFVGIDLASRGAASNTLYSCRRFSSSSSCRVSTSSTQAAGLAYDRGGVAASIAIIGCTPDCHNLAVKHQLRWSANFRSLPARTDLVTLHDELVCSCNQLDIVIVVELLDHVVSEQEPRSSWRLAQPCDLCVCSVRDSRSASRVTNRPDPTTADHTLAPRAAPPASDLSSGFYTINCVRPLARDVDHKRKDCRTRSTYMI